MIVYTVVWAANNEAPCIVQSTNKAHADAVFRSWDTMRDETNGDRLTWCAFDVDANTFVTYAADAPV